MLPVRDHLPTRIAPVVNYALIGANVAVFLYEESQIAQGANAEALTFHWGLVPARLWVHPVAAIETVFSSMFMHGSLAHIGGNMLFLWIFGDNVEDALGHGGYLGFYLAGGVCAAAAQILVDPSSRVPMVGASGAISAVLAAYVFLFPRSPITVINPVPLFWLFFGLFLQLPAWFVIGEFFLVNLWDAMAHAQLGGIAFAAHVGGFLGGALLLREAMSGRPRMDDYARWKHLAERRRRRDDSY